SLPDVRRSAEHGRAAAAVELELDRGLRHLVRVDAVVGPADVHAAGETDAAPARQLAELARPARGLLHRLETLQEAVRGDTQAVPGRGVLADEVAPAQLEGVELQRLGQLVELALHREARLHRAVAALGPAAGLVGEDARRVEAVGRQGVGRRDQLPRIVG